ncbi:MAG: glycosyltransferase family 2 protein [Chloroflexaceae bacterium]|nr:glycosyltransferase family 2 protein [Chloroflexaceae bacterium]
MTPVVTVVIPAYNAASWIAATLERVLAQDIANIEVIVIDDGSTDATASVVARFAQVRCLSQPNQGQAAARNRGIEAAQGDYIAFCDADDLWQPHKLRVQLDLLRQRNLAWGYCDYHAFEHQSGATLWRHSDRFPLYDGDILRHVFLLTCTPLPSMLIVRRDVFATVGLFQEAPIYRQREDWDMNLRIAARYPIGWCVSRWCAIACIPPVLREASRCPSFLPAVSR